MSESLPGPAVRRALLRSALLLGGLVAAGFALRAIPGGLDAGLLERLVIGQGWRGEAFFVLVAALLCAVGLPRQASSFAAGYAFGIWAGIPLALLAQILGCAVSFFWARLIARDWARRRVLRPGGRAARLNGFLATNPVSVTLTVRLLPVGHNLAFNLLAGVSAVRAIPFLAASALGYAPQTIVFTVLGSGIGVDDGVRTAIGAVLLVGSALLGLWLLRRHRAEAEAVSEAG